MEVMEAARVSQRQGADTDEVRRSWRIVMTSHRAMGGKCHCREVTQRTPAWKRNQSPEWSHCRGGDRIASTEPAVWVPGCVPLFLAPWPEMSLMQGPASVAPGSCWVAWEGVIVALCPVM